MVKGLILAVLSEALEKKESQAAGHLMLDNL